MEDKNMGSKKTSIFSAAMLAVIVMTGWSCSGGTGFNNNEPDTISGPKTYRNSDWGVSFQYPAGWNYREYQEVIEGEEITTLAFSDQELPETLPPEPLFPIMVSVDSGTVEDAMLDYTDAVSTEDVTLGSRVVKKVIYYSNILEQNDRIYLAPLRSGILRVLVADNTIYVTAAETMIATLTETE
jgi:hypothetical protein